MNRQVTMENGNLFHSTIKQKNLLAGYINLVKRAVNRGRKFGRLNNFDKGMQFTRVFVLWWADEQRQILPLSMDEFLPILEYVSKYIDLTEEEKIFFVSLLRIRKVRKKQFIGQPEFVNKYRSYIVSGAMRAYIIDEKGGEHTIAIAIEDWWIGDFSSYLFQTPATYFVEALEDTVLIELEYEAEQNLFRMNPKFNLFFRKVLERQVAALQERLLSNLSKSAEQRYDRFLKKYPHLLNRIPQYILASYLGFSTEFFSKIRNKKAKKLN